MVGVWWCHELMMSCMHANDVMYAHKWCHVCKRYRQCRQTHHRVGNRCDRKLRSDPHAWRNGFKHKQLAQIEENLIYKLIQGNISIRNLAVSFFEISCFRNLTDSLQRFWIEENLIYKLIQLSTEIRNLAVSMFFNGFKIGFKDSTYGFKDSTRGFKGFNIWIQGFN